MIRIATEADVPQILAIYAPYILTTTYSFEYTVPSEEEFLTRFRNLTKQFPWLVWEEDGKILGYAYGSAPFERAAYSWCAEDSLYLLPEVRGRGIGKKLLKTLEEILKSQGYRLIYAIITSENTNSLAFHEKCGYSHLAEFQNCGYKFGRQLGVVWMEKVLLEGDFPKDFPVSWQVFIQNDKNFVNILDTLSLS